MKWNGVQWRAVVWGRGMGFSGVLWRGEGQCCPLKAGSS